MASDDSSPPPFSPYIGRPIPETLRFLGRWLLWPLLYLASVQVFLLYPERVQESMPDIFFGAWQTSGTSLAAPEFPLPEKYSSAFQLGTICSRGQRRTEAGETEEALLEEAWGVMHPEAFRSRPPELRITDVCGMHTRYLEQEARETVLQRITGIFSLVNFLWLVAILGIALTVTPCLALVANPIFLALALLWSHVLRPLLRALVPLYEPLAYAVCYGFIVQGSRYDPDTGPFIALTGVFLTFPAFLYSTRRHTVPSTRIRGFLQIHGVYFALLAGPLAVHYQSQLLGWLTVIYLYSALGFSAISTGLCYFVGFRSMNALVQSVGTSLTLLLFVCGLRMSCFLLESGVFSRMVYPFLTALLVMGNLVYFLGMLILASKFVGGKMVGYAWMQILMINSLLLAIGFGFLFDLPAMTNTAITFAALYAVEKFVEWDLWNGELVIIPVFGCFVLIYIASLFLRTHPDWIWSLASTTAFAKC